MFRKIRSLVSSYDERFFAWLEGKSIEQPLPDRNSGKGTDARSRKSSRSVDTKRSKIQIPDPWD